MQFVVIDKPGPLSKSKHGNQYVVLTIDHYSELRKVTPTAKTTATTALTIFLDDWITSYKVPGSIAHRQWKTIVV